MSTRPYRLLLILHVMLIAAEVGSLFLLGDLQACVDSCAPQPGWLTGESWAAASVLVAMIVVWIAGLIGLFLFKRWGRTLSVFSTVASLASYPFLGTTAMSGVSALLAEAATLTWGAAIALAYFSSLGSLFER